MRLSYDKETLVGWRAIKAIGFAAREMLEDDYPFLRETVRKLLWSLSDESGEIGWPSPEMLGEIVSAGPEKFRDIIPLIAEVYALEETVFRSGVLYALVTIAEAGASFVLPHKDLVFKGLTDKDPVVRVYALELAGMVKEKLPHEDKAALLPLVQKLITDNAEVWIYKNGTFNNMQVSEAANRVK